MFESCRAHSFRMSTAYNSVCHWRAATAPLPSYKLRVVRCRHILRYADGIQMALEADTNPFVHSHPVPPADLIDRDDETAALLANAAGSHYTRLYAPRQYGKTSLLTRVLQDAEAQAAMVPVLVDFFGALSLADVTIRRERAYAKHLRGKLRDRIHVLLVQTGLGLSLGAMGVSAKLQLDPRRDPLPALHALLDLPLRLKQERGRRALIVFDEFQALANVKEMDAIFRSHLQFHGDVASYVFSGSEPGLMKMLFERKDRPLYGQTVPVRLGRLGAPDISAYVVDRFNATARSAGDGVNALVDAAEGHPQRAMLLANRLWQEVPRGGAATRAEWDRAYARTLSELGPEFDSHWRRFSSTEQKTLRAILAGGGSPYRTRVLQRLDLSKASAQKALTNLMARAEVEPAEKTYVIVDPLFAQWIERLAGD